MSRSHADAVAELTAPGGPFELVEERIGGIPMQVYAHAPRSLSDLFEASTAHGERDWLVYRDERCTFAEHAAIVSGLARHLTEAYGVRKGDRVAIAMRNFPEWSFAFWATQLLGAVCVPLNAWSTGPELRDVVADSGADVLVLDGERMARLAPHLQALAPRAVILVRSEGVVPDGGGVRVDTWEDVRASLDLGAPRPDVDLAPDDDSTILYTSGTTGRAKGAVGTHRNHVTNYLNVCLRNAARTLVAAGGGAAVAGPPPAALATYPFFHISGLNWLYINAAVGNTLCLQYKWDLDEALRLIERHRIGSLALVPTLLRQLLESSLLDRHDVSSVRSIASGGGPVPPDLVALVERRLGPDVSFVNGYGLTETTSAVIVNVGKDYRERPTSVGRPVSVVEVRVSDPESGRAAADGEVGELEVRGPNVVRGYWGLPDVTADVFRDGWFRTGDLGRIDEDGYVHVVDRLKDVVIRGGENVYCVEVEAVLRAQPGVVDAAVVGVPHPELGEEVAAIVQCRSEADLSVESVRDHAAANLAYFKVPARIQVQSEPLPRTATGKVLKGELRARFAASG